MPDEETSNNGNQFLGRNLLKGSTARKILSVPHWGTGCRNSPILGETEEAHQVFPY